MRILVTGGAGFIGSHTCLSLMQRGYEIIVIDSFVNSNEVSLDRVIKILKRNSSNKNLYIKTLRSDIRDEKKLIKLFSESQKEGNPIKAVFHFAGLKSVRESVLNPLLFWDVNVNGAIKLFQVMDRYECRTIVFSSSASIYGSSNSNPILEDTKIKPISPYGKTKAAVEQLLNDIYSDKWRIANLRYFNPIGAHRSGLIGEAPMNVPSNIFPYLTQVAAGTLEKLTVFGNNWPTKDGTGVRDYIHVMDLAEGHIAALEYLLKGEPQIINMNLGTGLGTSVLELINIFESTNKIKIPYVFSSRRKGDVPTLIADNSLAISSLDWSPKRGLNEMCADAWKWQSLNPYGYK